MPWIAEVHAVPIMEAAGLVQAAVTGTIAPLVKRLGLEGGVLGLDEAAYCQMEALRNTLPGVRLTDGDAVMQAARRIKFPEEIALMEEACAIAEAVTQSAVDAVKPGVRETDVVAEAMHTLYRLGGEMPHVTTPFVASGERMAPPQRSASDKILRDGDVVFIDIGAMWSGYFGDMGRTVICGKPIRRQQEVYTCGARRPGGRHQDDDGRTHQRRRRRGGARGGHRPRPGGQFHQPLHRARNRHGVERAALCRRVAARRRDGRCSRRA